MSLSKTNDEKLNNHANVIRQFISKGRSEMVDWKTLISPSSRNTMNAHLHLGRFFLRDNWRTIEQLLHNKGERGSLHREGWGIGKAVGSEGSLQNWRRRWAPLCTFSLHLDSSVGSSTQELWTIGQASMDSSWTPCWELTPARTLGPHRTHSCTRSPALSPLLQASWHPRWCCIFTDPNQPVTALSTVYTEVTSTQVHIFKWGEITISSNS